MGLLYFQTIKDTLIRTFIQFSYFEPDVVKMSSRPEWAPFLHNLCYLHGALQLKARLGRAGWNRPQEFFNLRFTELFVSEYLLRSNSNTNLQVSSLPKLLMHFRKKVPIIYWSSNIINFRYLHTVCTRLWLPSLVTLYSVLNLNIRSVKAHIFQPPPFRMHALLLFFFRLCL